MFTKRFSRTLSSKLRVGRVGVPLWMLLVGTVVLAGAAGQALGPVLASSTSGVQQATVTQTIRIGGTAPAQYTTALTIEGEAITPTSAVDFAGTVNDEKTQFRIASVVRVGQTGAFTLDLANPSGQSANFIVEITAPANMDVAVNDLGSDSNVSQLARLGTNTWLGTLVTDPATPKTTDIVIVYEAKDDATPGSYQITGTIRQVTH